MSLVDSVLAKYGPSLTPTDAGTSVSSVSGSPGHLGKDGGTFVTDVGDSERTLRQRIPGNTATQEPLGHSLTKLSKDRETDLPSVIYGMRIGQLKQAAGSDWPHIIEEPRRLVAFADAVRTTGLLRQGKVPPHYTATTLCRHYGPVPIFEGCPAEVIGCPWCFAGTKPGIPRQA